MALRLQKVCNFLLNCMLLYGSKCKATELVYDYTWNNQPVNGKEEGQSSHRLLSTRKVVHGTEPGNVRQQTS